MDSMAVSAAASVIPFHCIICYDEFNLTDRAPVILPCGHTYLCEPCSKRITTCMECRVPLFWMPPPPKPMPFLGHRNTINQRYANRYQAPQAAPSSPVKPPKPIPLPIPKNVVLMAMLEAAERQAMMAAGSVMDVSHDDIEDEVDVTQDDDEDAELIRIVSGMESFSGPCGTYAVRDEEGLAVLPQDPRRRSHEQIRDPDETREPFTIERGQTVQVVDVKGDVFKLARDMGYVVASESQLVKVGGPLDKSCQFEGTLHLVERRRKELQQQLEQFERLSHSLKADMEELEGQDPTHPIITLPPAPENQEQSPNPALSCPSTPVPTKLDSPIPQSPTIVTAGADGVELTENFNHPQSPYPPHDSPTRLTSPYSIDNSDITRRYSNLTGGNNLSLYGIGDSSTGMAQFGCSSLLSFGQNYDDSDDDINADGLIGLSFDSETSDAVSNRPPTLTCTPRMHGVCAVPRAVSSPHINSPPRTPSFDAIDFRTGMSGHRGLMSTRTADPRATPRGRPLMMSEHMGISRMRGPNRSDTRSVGQQPASPSRKLT